MLESQKINKVSMQIPTDKIYFNQTDRSIQAIKLPTIWKHLLSDTSKAVETFPAKMAEEINNHYRTERFSAPECHSNENISAEKKKHVTMKMILDYGVLNSNITFLVTRLPFLIGKISIEPNSKVIFSTSSSSSLLKSFWSTPVLLTIPENRRDENWV